MILSQYAKKLERGDDEDLSVTPVHVRVDCILKDGIATGLVSEYPKGLHMFMHKYGIDAITN